MAVVYKIHNCSDPFSFFILIHYTREDEMAGWHHRLNGHEFE